MTMMSHSRRAIALVGALLAPVTASAQYAGAPAASRSSVEDVTSAYTNAIEVGAGYVNLGSFAFGRFTGLTDKNAFGKGNLLVRGRDLWEAGGTRYWEVVATDAGLTSRSVSARAGNQGVWNASAFYNQIPYNQSDSAVTIFGNAGAARLALPAGLPTNTNPALGAQLQPFLQPLDFSVERKTFGGAVSARPGSDWEIAVSLSREHKDGVKEQSLSVNVRTDPTFFPEPVDYDTTNVEATIAYNRQKAQVQVGYVYSSFTNANPAVVLPSPYLGVLSQPVGALSQYALPPGSSAHDLSLAAAFNLAPAVRLNVNLGYGVQSQNEALLPYTLNPAFAGTELPRTSLDGKFTNTLAQFRLTAQPTAKLALGASVTYDRRKNETPREAYESMQEPEWEDLLNYSVPFGFTDKNAKVDASYRLWTGGRLAVDYAYQERDRTYAEVVKQTEQSVRAKLFQSVGSGTGYVSYLHSVRKAAEYVPYAFDFAQGNLPSTTPLFPYPNNQPYSGYLLEPNFYLFRRFYMADRTRDEVKAGASADLGDSFSLAVAGRRTSDDYSHSQYGITDSKSWATDADLGYNVAGKVELHAFYTYETIQSDQTSLASTGIVSTNPIAQWTWNSRYKDRVHTVGVSSMWNVTSRVRVGPQYELSLANTDIDVVSGPGAGTSAQYVSMPVPAIQTSSYGAKAIAEFLLRPNATLRIVYDFEHLSTKDPALNTGPLPNTAATNLSGVVGAPAFGWLLGGTRGGAYRIHVVTASLIWRF